MVTATGPGGVGKTRLALSVAADVAPAHRDGVWFVDLVHVTDPAMVTAAVAETVGVPEQRSVSVEVALVASLAERDALLVLDNCEHLLQGVRDCVERILAGCPDVTVLATSRTRLLVPYEWVYAVPGLSVTGDSGDAVDLFAARVAAATGDPAPPDSARVATLCRALDGMALAIELAAARFSTLGLDGLEAGLDERLRFLTAGTRMADRHRSLRDAIGWSYDLLSPEDRALLRSVAVFASWFDVEAANAVAGSGNERAAVADGLARLADHSLLVVERGDPTRYRALETIRQYGVERLELAGELDTVRARHERWCRAVMGALHTAEPDDAWCARFDSVVDDIRAALLCSACDEQCWAQAAAMANDLAGLLFVRGRPMEAQRRYEQAADLAPAATDKVGYLRLAAGAAASRFVGNDALRLFRRAADTAVSIGDRAGAARDLATMAMYISRAPGIMADQHTEAEATALVAEARTVSDGSPLAEAAIAVAAAYHQLARDPRAVDVARQAVDLAEQAADGVLQSAALDLLCSEFIALYDLPEAVRVVRRRGAVIRALALDAGSGFEHGDFHLYASDVDLTAGDLVAAGNHADALAGLPFYRDEDHLAIARRLRVDALAGAFDDVVRSGERFRLGWERAGGRSRRTSRLRRTPWRWCTASSATMRVVPSGCASPSGSASPRNDSPGARPAGRRRSMLCWRSTEATPAQPSTASAPISTISRSGGAGAAASGGPGTPPCGPRPLCSTITPTRPHGSTGAVMPPATTRSRRPSSNAPRRSPPATTPRSSVSRSPSPSSAALTSRRERAGWQPASGDSLIAADRPPVGDRVADGRGRGVAQLVVGSCAQRVVHGGEGDAQGDECRDREDLPVVVAGVA